MNDKNVIIFGDSYSTFIDSIPEGYAPYYTGSRESGPDIHSADESWWGMLIKETGWNLVRNDSWSGSTIGYRGYDNADYSKTSSFIFRLEKLADEDFFRANNINTVLVFGGTNDSWCGAELGEEMYTGWQREDLYKVLPAVGCYFTKLRETLPDAEIYGICNSGIKQEIIDAIKHACDRIGAKTITLTEVEKEEDHPTARGMVEIKDQILKAINN